MAPLPLQFLIAGSGVGAYAAALALRRVGHEVLVLEPESEPLFLPGSSRVPPNMTKILFGWDLEDECRALGIVSRYVTMVDYFTGAQWGMHQWDEEILKETRGVFLLMHQTDVRDLLKKKAVELGARVRRNVRIAAFDVEAGDGETPGVRLESGEVIHANVIVGADGRPSQVREVAFDIQDPRTPTHLIMFDVTVSIPVMMEDPELRSFIGNYQNESQMQCICGDGHAILSNPVGGVTEYSMHMTVPDDGLFDGKPTGEWLMEVPVERVLKAMGKCDPRLQKLVRSSHTRLAAKVMKQLTVEDWVHPDANMVLIGGAAHPFHAGAVYSRSMSVEDAACLAEIFSHVSHLDQIRSFLYAFQEIRQPRCDEIRQMEELITHTMTMSAEEAEATRDRQIKAALQEGKGAMSNLGFDELVSMFAYEADDAANDWWVTWGLPGERLRERERQANQEQHFEIKQSVIYTQEGAAAASHS